MHITLQRVWLYRRETGAREKRSGREGEERKVVHCMIEMNSSRQSVICSLSFARSLVRSCSRLRGEEEIVPFQDQSSRREVTSWLMFPPPVQVVRFELNAGKYFSLFERKMIVMTSNDKLRHLFKLVPSQLSSRWTNVNSLFIQAEQNKSTCVASLRRNRIEKRITDVEWQILLAKRRKRKTTNVFRSFNAKREREEKDAIRERENQVRPSNWIRFRLRRNVVDRFCGLDHLMNKFHTWDEHRPIVTFFIRHPRQIQIFDVSNRKRNRRG